MRLYQTFAALWTGAEPQPGTVSADPRLEAPSMGRTHTRFIGAVAALLAAGLAGFSLRSQQRSVSTVAARNPAPDVRTQVIRRTIHITRHEHARHGMGPSGGGSRLGRRGASPAASAVHTGASGSHRVGSGTTVSASGAAVTTRTSAPHSPASAAVSGAPVATRTSTSHGGSGSTTGSGSSGGPVTTRTSSHGSGGSTTGSGHVTTRSSGGHGGDGSDGGDGGDHGGD